MKKQIVLASANKGKVKEFQEILTDYEIVSFKEILPNLEIEETGETFYDNALIKAKSVWTKIKGNVLADDSGLNVMALGGAPGVHTARYAGEKATDEENMDKLLRELTGEDTRSAKFCCQLAMITESGEIVTGYGETEGEILREKKGHNGFGYNPIFYSKEIGKSFGEAEEDEKNEISHRGRAIKELVEKLNHR